MFLSLCFNEGVTAASINQKPLIEKKEDKKEKKKRSRKRKVKDILVDSLNIKNDSLGIKNDSLTISTTTGAKKIELLLDSLRKSGVVVDSLTIDSLARHYFSDTLKVKAGVLPRVNASGSLLNARILDSLLFAERLAQNNLENEKTDRLHLFRDTIPFSKMSAISVVFPGYGQMYNKQYWKLPILYGGVAAFATTGAIFGKKSRSIKKDFDLAVANKDQANIDYHYGKYRDSKTVSTLMYAGAVATYMYFMADAAFNYKGVEDNKNRATYLALMFPGAGQIYNEQYWKLPIVYGGFATMAYILNFNGRGYTRYKRAYDNALLGLPHEFEGRMTDDQLKNGKNSFRRARDMSIFFMAGFYILTVVDAYVSASFKQYDISDDLSVRVAPLIDYNQMGTMPRESINGTYGMSMSFTF